MPAQGHGLAWPQRRKAFISENYLWFAGEATFYFPDALSVASVLVPDAADQGVAEIPEPRSLSQSCKTRRRCVIQPVPQLHGPSVSFYGHTWDRRYRWFRLQTSLR